MLAEAWSGSTADYGRRKELLGRMTRRAGTVRNDDQESRRQVRQHEREAKRSRWKNTEEGTGVMRMRGAAEECR